MAVVALAAVMVASGAASAASIRAPFKGQAEYFDVQLLNGCETLKTPVKQHVDVATGVARMDVVATASNCRSGVGHVFYSEVQEEYSPNALIPLKLANGPHSIAVHESTALQLNTTVVLGTANLTNCETYPTSYIDPSNGSFDYNFTNGFCTTQSSVDVNAIPVLFDATNDTFLFGNDAFVESIGVYNSTQVDFGCYGPGYGLFTSSGGCFSNNLTAASSAYTAAVAFTAPGVAYVNGTFVHGHSYFLWWEITADLQVEVQADPGAHASATINFGGPGLGIDLRSIGVH